MTLSIESKLREISNLCRQAGEQTSWLAPKIDAVIFDMVRERTTEDERADVLAFLGAAAKKHRQTAAESARHSPAFQDHAFREDTIERAKWLENLAERFGRGDHIGTATRKEAP